MRRLTFEEAAGGKQVMYTGRATPANVTDLARVEDGRILMDNHPGTIARVSDDRQVFVTFLGLEDQPVSDLGFVPDADGHYPGLVLVTPEEWVAACAVGWWSTLATPR